MRQTPTGHIIKVRENCGKPTAAAGSNVNPHTADERLTAIRGGLTVS